MVSHSGFSRQTGSQVPRFLDVTLPAGRGAGRLALLLFGLAYAGAAAQAPPSTLKIVVLEGEGAINNIRVHRSKDPVVQVVDADNAPIKGASVSFLLPDNGPSGEFGAGVRTAAVITDDKGRAVGQNLVPNGSAGPYQIRVVASFGGQMATAVINQTNAEPASASIGHSSKKLWLLGAIGGAVAAGVAVAVMGHGGSAQPAAANQPGIVITSGAPAFQPPH